MSSSFDAKTSGSANGEFSIDTTGELVSMPSGTSDLQIYAEAAILYSRKTDGTGKFSAIDATTWTTVTGCPDGLWLKSVSGTVAGDMDAIALRES